MAFQMATKQGDDVVVVELTGTLDTLAADDLKTALNQVLRTGRKHIVLSLKGAYPRTTLASTAWAPCPCGKTMTGLMSISRIRGKVTSRWDNLTRRSRRASRS